MAREIVVSGASRGLGASIARMHLEKGDIVHLIVRKESDFVKEAEKRYPEKVRVHFGDIASVSLLKNACREIIREIEHIDILYNVAAVFNEADKCGLNDLDFDIAPEIYNINALGPLRVLQQLDPVIDGKTRIVNVSSQSGSCEDTDEVTKYAYSMSKAALNFASKLYYREKQRGRNIIVVCPGWMRTDMGGAEADLDPDESAEGIIHLAEDMENLDPDWMFFKYNGSKIHW